MTEVITRMYGSVEQAEGAAAALKKVGYEDVFLVKASGAGEGAAATSKEEIAEEIMRGYIPKSDAMIYADGVARGGSLVSVHAPWGTSVKATGIMSGFSPIDSGISYSRSIPAITYDDAAPLSSVFGWPVLIDEKSTFSGFWNFWPLLSRPGPTFSGMKMISDNPAPLSSKIGLPTLSDNPAPLSSKIGMRTLLDNPAPLSAKIGMRTLLDNPAPLSSKIGMPLLSSKPTPLSSALGLPVLSKHRSESS